jgi:hypothetical protein
MTFDRKAYWTPERREEHAAKLRAHYADRPGPMTGKKMPEETKQLLSEKRKAMKVRGHCRVCGRPLYDPEVAKRGIGDECLAKEEEGD